MTRTVIIRRKELAQILRQLGTGQTLFTATKLKEKITVGVNEMLKGIIVCKKKKKHFW